MTLVSQLARLSLFALPTGTITPFAHLHCTHNPNQSLVLLALLAPLTGTRNSPPAGALGSSHRLAVAAQKTSRPVLVAQPAWILGKSGGDRHVLGPCG